MKSNSFKLYYLDSLFNDGKQVRVKDFNLIQLVGKGQLAKVYKTSLQNNCNIFYALKVLSMQQLIDLEIIDYLKQEIQILSQCSHKNIIKLHTAFLEDDQVYMVMEYAAQGNLYQKLKKEKKFNEQKTVQYMNDIIQALIYLHSKNPPILHRDIKPENILICNDKLKIADFGWSNFKTDIRNTYCGTPDYLSPEMILGTNHNEKTDIWSLGVLLYELLHGRPCFQPKNIPLNNRAAQKLIEKNILKGKVKMDPSLSFQAKNAIGLMLNPDSKLRPFAKDLLKMSFFQSYQSQKQNQSYVFDNQSQINQQIQKAYRLEQQKVKNLTVKLHEKEEEIHQCLKQNNLLKNEIEQIKKQQEIMFEEYKKISISTKESEKRKSQNRQQDFEYQLQSLRKEIDLQKKTNLMMFEKSRHICNLVNKLYQKNNLQEQFDQKNDDQKLSFDETLSILNFMINKQQNQNSSQDSKKDYQQNKGYTFQNIKFNHKVQNLQFLNAYGYQRQYSLNNLKQQMSLPRSSNFNGYQLIQQSMHIQQIMFDQISVEIFQLNQNENVQFLNFQVIETQKNETCQQFVQRVLQKSNLNVNLFCKQYNLAFERDSLLKGFNGDQLKKILLGDMIRTRNSIKLLIKEEKKKQENFIPLKKYSFYDASEKFGGIILTLQNINKINTEQIQVEFKKKSLQVKVINLDKKNYVFAVPNLHYKIVPEQSNYRVKKDQIVLKLKKQKEGTPFDILYKQKMIGEVSSDEN